MEPTHDDRPAEKRHVPVLLDTSVELLAPALQEPGSIHVDATLGMGGHAAAVLQAAPHAHLVGIDRDPQALELARERLDRAGVGERATQRFGIDQMLPSPAQGALAVECREDDEVVLAALRPLDDPDTRAATSAERGVLAELEAGCAAPVGALAEVVEDDNGPILSLRAVVAATDGSGELRRSITGPLGEAEDLGRRLARTLIADGAPALADLSATHPTTASEHAQ